MSNLFHHIHCIVILKARDQKTQSNRQGLDYSKGKHLGLDLDLQVDSTSFLFFIFFMILVQNMLDDIKYILSITIIQILLEIANVIPYCNFLI